MSLRAYSRATQLRLHRRLLAVSSSSPPLTSSSSSTSFSSGPAASFSTSSNSRLQASSHSQLQASSLRSSADKKPSAQAGVDAAIHGTSQEQAGTNARAEHQQPHISEEAAAISQIKGEQGPDVEQGTRVEDVLRRDKDLNKADLPKVMQDALNAQNAQKDSSSSSSSSSSSASGGANPNGKRQFSTSSRAYTPTAMRSQQLRVLQKQFSTLVIRQAAADTAAVVPASNAEIEAEASDSGLTTLERDVQELSEYFEDPHANLHYPDGSKLLFDAPASTESKQINMRKRHEPIVDQITKLIMRDGKLGKAQRHVADILNNLRTSSPPRPHAEPKGTLLMPVAYASLPLNPVQYLTVAIDSIAPLFRLRSQKGIAGGGVSVQIPVPLWQRQRRRAAITWILDAVQKKSRGGSILPFARRFADEIQSIVEGKSSVWEKRRAVHSLGIRARANLQIATRRRF